MHSLRGRNDDETVVGQHIAIATVQRLDAYCAGIQTYFQVDSNFAEHSGLRCGAELVLSLPKDALAFGNPLRGFANRETLRTNGKNIRCAKIGRLAIWRC